MQIVIEPLDPVFFRDGKPFEKGEDSWASSLALPLPSTILGAFRSLYLSHRPIPRENLNTQNDPSTNLRIQGIFLRSHNSTFVPLPNDLVKRKMDSSNDSLLELVMSPTNSLQTSNQSKTVLPEGHLDCFLGSSENVEAVQHGLLSLADLEDYLEQEATIYPLETLENRIVSEPKVGIGRNLHSHQANEGQLYRVQMQRWKDLQLIVDLDVSALDEVQQDWFKEGWIKLGGEGKVAHFQKWQSHPIAFSKPKLKQGDRFKLYLLTPSVFQRGWLPKWIDPQTKKSTDYFKSCRLKLITAAIGKPVLISGFDMKANRPRGKQQGVPAGSVYYFEVEDVQKSEGQELIDKLHYKSIAEDSEMNRAGFGVTLVSHGSAL